MMNTQFVEMTDDEIRSQGFRILVEAFGDVNAERFITLTIREPMDYTKWRARNMYLDDDLHSLAERARRTGARFEAARKQSGVAPSATESIHA